MCSGNTKCSKCSAADGDVPAYDPAQIATWINKYIYNDSASAETLQDSYVKTMMYLEANNLPFTEESISTKKDEITVAINDPNFIKKMDTANPKARNGYQMAFIVIAIILIGYFLFKD